jgi:hypothetical protein
MTSAERRPSTQQQGHTGADHAATLFQGMAARSRAMPQKPLSQIQPGATVWLGMLSSSTRPVIEVHRASPVNAIDRSSSTWVTQPSVCPGLLLRDRLDQHPAAAREKKEPMAIGLCLTVQ